MKREFKARELVLISLAFILCIVLIVRLFLVQIARGEYYEELAAYRSLRIVDTQAIRGRILDRNGVVLAKNVPSFDLVLGFDDLRDQQKEFETVGKIIGMTPEEIKDIVEKADVPGYFEVVIKRSLSDKERIAIEELQNELPGFKVKVSSKRVYPFGSIGECFLGYVGPVSREDLEADDYYSYTDYVGKQGLELAYEKALRGKKGQREVLLDSLGRVQQVIFETPAIPGADVYLTIDIEVQKRLEEIVGERTGVSIVMSDNGEILAMVSHPSFDPNLLVRGISEKEFQELLSKGAFLNRATQASYPPGSTFKPVTLIAALESGTITPSTTLNCAGYIYIGNRMFKDWIYPAGFGVQTPAIALANSSDVFFYQIGMRTGIENIAKYARLFNLEQKSGIDIPFESSGLIPDAQWKVDTFGENWYLGDTANCSIGQGFVLATPIEMATFYQSLANKGIAYQPHLMLKVVSSGGQVIESYAPEVVFQYNLKKETLETVFEGLRGLANKPDMKLMRVRNLEVYAKTGTAEVGDGSVHHWLISILENGSNRMVGLLFFERSQFSSSHALAPLMRDLWESVLYKD